MMFKFLKITQREFLTERERFKIHVEKLWGLREDDRGNEKILNESKRRKILRVNTQVV